MTALQLLCKWRDTKLYSPKAGTKTIPQQPSKENDEEAVVYLVPSLLQDTNQETELAPLQPGESGARLSFQATTDNQPLMPATMFPRVVCLCVEHSLKLPFRRVEPSVSKHKATFDFGGQTLVQLSVGPHWLDIRADQPNGETLEVGRCSCWPVDGWREKLRWCRCLATFFVSHLFSKLSCIMSVQEQIMRQFYSVACHCNSATGIANITLGTTLVAIFCLTAGGERQSAPSLPRGAGRCAAVPRAADIEVVSRRCFVQDCTRVLEVTQPI